MCLVVIFLFVDGGKQCASIQWEFSTYIMLFAESYNFKLNKSFPQFMCFLKFIAPAHSAPLTPPTCSSPPQKMEHQGSAFSAPLLKPQSAFDSSAFNMLNCLKLLSFNSQLLQDIDQKLTASSQMLEKGHGLVHSGKRVSEPECSTCEHLQDSDSTVVEGLQATSEELTSRLFGQHGYKYKLVLADQLAETLYKDRNFKLNVKLVNLATGEVENNGNLINICLSVCDSKGEWIHEAKEGGAFLKGKLEADLYHGLGEFVKLSPRDVSRNFTDKKVNIVVYAKPSMLKYSGESSIERIVDFKLVEPLVVKDICIKAKKRQ